MDLLIARSEVAVIGADGGGLDDLFGVCVIGREKMTRRWLVWCKAFAHPKVLERRKEIAPRLKDFEAEGSLTFCEISEYVEAIAEIAATLRAAGLLPDKKAVGFDPNNIAGFVDALALRGIEGDMLQRLRQGPALSPALWGLEHKLSDDTLSHDGSDLMSWSVGNVKIEVKLNGNMATKEFRRAGKDRCLHRHALRDDPHELEPRRDRWTLGLRRARHPDGIGGAAVWDTSGTLCAPHWAGRRRTRRST